MVRITHPFHPQHGQAFEAISRSPHWGEERVIYRAADGTLPTVAVSLTDMAPLDPFRLMASGRAAFRMVDLRRLVGVLDHITASMEGDGV